MKPGTIIATFTRKADGAVFEAFLRKDRIARPDGTSRPAYGWRKRNRGRIVFTAGTPLERYRAIGQAKREAAAK